MAKNYYDFLHIKSLSMQCAQVYDAYGHVEYVGNAATDGQ